MFNKKSVMSMLSLLSLLVLFVLTASQSCRDDISSCSSCLQSSPICVWCSKLDYNDSSCFERGSVNYTANCGEDNVIDLRSNLTTDNIDSDPGDNVTVGSGDINNTTTNVNEPETLVNPDIVFLETRANDVHLFNVTISIPFNYPLDFYYLMDLSGSMADDLTTIQTLSPDIIKTLENLTTNFRVGFGAFSDKEALPFTFERETEEFCPKDGACTYSNLHPPFDFIHYQSLTANGTEFTESIGGLGVTTNRDVPESTLDALLQASVCTEIIGWRPTASHIILIATDAPYHIAGDGKLVGALHPNDMKCHMSKLADGTYTYDKSLELDYPSLGQINFAMEEQRIIPIFTLINSNTRYNTSIHYQDLTDQLQVNSHIANLEDGSLGILDLIRDSYNSLAQSISLTVPSVAGVNISVRPLCNQTEGAACVDVSRGETATFEVSVEITDCDAVKDVQNITLQYPFLAISITVQLTALCDCECEKDKVTNSSVCNYRGDFSCGRCQCTEGFGRLCECKLPEGADPNNQGSGYDQCPVHNETQCNSPHGRCVCNECVCEDNYEGDACEDLCTCKSDCGGPSRGTCTCDGCMCNEPYTGEDCGCTTETSNCTDSQNVLCSNNGQCVCNICQCDSNDCQGPLCERCRDELLQCNSHRVCVQCTLSNTGEASVTRPSDCTDACQSDTMLISPLNSSQSENHKINSFDARRCSFTDDGNCFYTFYVAVNEEYYLQTLEIENTLRCASASSSDDNNLIWIIPLAIVVGLLVLGLIILLIIKLFLLILDYVEVRQFERAVRDAEGKLAQTSQPLYQSPVVEYQNLAYGIEKKDKQ